MTTETTTATNVETYKSLRIVRETSSKDMPAVKIWRGKAKRPFANFYFLTEERREQFIAQKKTAEDDRITAKLQRKAQDDQHLAKMCDTIQVGTILCYSWGYEQTNIEFFQVVAKKNRSVTLRAIGDTEVLSEGFSSMSSRCKPNRDQFAGSEFKKLITAWGIKMPHGSCSPVDSDDQLHYRSWYA